MTSSRRRTWSLATAVLASAAVLMTAGCGSRLSDSALAAAGGGGPGVATTGSASGTTGGAATTTGGTGTSGDSTGAGATGTGGTGEASAAPGADTSGTSGAAGTGTTGTTATGTGAVGTTTGTASGTGVGTTGATTAKGTTSTTTGAKGTTTTKTGTTTTKTGTTKTGATGTTATTTNTGSTTAASGSTFPGFNSAIFGGTAPCAPATGSPISIGNVSTLTGVLGLLFAPVKPALNVFVQAQNACGGLNGHPIQLTIEDDQDDPSVAVEDCQDEIQNHHVLAFVGNIQVLTIDQMRTCVDSNKIPIIGGDITNDTWFSDPLLFPEGAPPEAISFGFLNSMVKTQGKTAVGDMYCLEVPQACTQIDKGFTALAPQLGATQKYSVQVSITATSYTTQCATMQSDGAQAVALIVDAPTMTRWVKSCQGVGYNPAYDAYPLGVGNESEFLKQPGLGNVIVPLQTFPWMTSNTPAEKFYQASVAKYNPGFTTGDAASDGWTSGALLVAASADLTATPTTAQLIQALDAFTGNNDDTLGGLTAPLTFHAGADPTVPYCLFSVESNSDDTAWVNPVDKAVCTSIVAPGAPA